MTNMDQPESTYNRFGQYLEALRQEFNFSQTHVSLKTGVNRKRMSTLERGLAEPRYDELEKFEEFYSANNKPIGKNKLFDPVELSVELYYNAGRIHPLLRESRGLLYEMVELYIRQASSEWYSRKTREKLSERLGSTERSYEDRVGQTLVAGGFINDNQLEHAREASQKAGHGLLDTLVSNGDITQETIVTILSYQHGVPVVDLRHLQPDPGAINLVPGDYARLYGILPTRFDTDDSLRVATRTPNNFQISDELSSITGRQTKWVFAIGGRLEDLINQHYPLAGDIPAD